MTIVVPFKGLRPSPRDDGIKWVQATIQEAPLAADEPGAFVDVESFVIADYPSASSPPTLNLTTNDATQYPGWYRVRFSDPSTGVEYTIPRLFSPETIRPSTKDVALHIKNRTVDNNNNFVGDFTSATAVTGDEVEDLIGKAQSRVMRRLDLDPNVAIATESQQAVADLIALYAAMLVELTKYSEQVAVGRSPYPQLKELFDESLPELREDITGIIEGEEPGVTSGTGIAQFTFPEDRGGMITWETRF